MADDNDKVGEVAAEQVVDDASPVGMRSSWLQSQSTTELDKSLCAARAKFKVVAKTVQGQTGNQTYKYAPLDELQQACDPHLYAAGIVYFWDPRDLLWWTSEKVRAIEMAFRLVHTESGQWRETRLTGHVPFVIDERTLKELGKVNTYLRRYTYQNLTGVIVARDDDDAASERDQRSSRFGPDSHDSYRGGNDPRRTPVNRKAGRPASPVKQTPDAQAVRKGAEELWANILQRTKGDTEAASSLLQQCTSFVPAGKTEKDRFHGWRDHTRISSLRMLKMAWHQLREHEHFGNAAMDYNDDNQPRVQRDDA